VEARSSITYWHPLRAPSGEIVAINVAAEEIAERKQVRRQAFDPFFTTRPMKARQGSVCTSCTAWSIASRDVLRSGASQAQEPSSG
jgi:hypothetical protein